MTSKVGTAPEESPPITGVEGSVSCTSTSGELAVFNVVAKPFNGTLSAALEYYIRLGHPTIAWSIPSGIGSQAVSFIGWTGELWYRLKQIAIAQSLEVVLLVLDLHAPGSSEGNHIPEEDDL